MSPRWALFCAVLPLLASCSGPNNCTLYESRFYDVSPAMESLQCYNDYISQIHCQWREELSTQGGMPLTLWNFTPGDNSEALCVPMAGPAISQGDRHRLMRCTFNTTVFAFKMNHTFFFKTPLSTSCSSFRHSLDLSQQLRVRPPVDLSFRTSGEGDLLIQWSSPYPDSSPLSRNLTYQLSYRREGQDTWIKLMNEKLTKTHLWLKKGHGDFPFQHPGCWYEARVRATGKTRGLWSEWSPLAMWKTPEAADQTPSMQCLLDEEEKVTCSWELRKELAHFITYQVECRHKQPNTISKWCCDLQEVTPVLRHSEALLRYRCSINASDPELLRLELVAKRNVKSFMSHAHIRPNPPSAVKVVEKGRNWIVSWKVEKPPDKVKLSYEVRYWSPLNESQEPHLISGPFPSLTITWASLSPSQLYKVQVRALLANDFYQGVPSEWSQPEEWTSDAACAWSTNTLIYVGLSVLVSILFTVLFCSIQSCRRKVLVWLNSSPSPDKSKLFLETKNLSCNNVLLQKEVTDICRVKHLDSFSSCSSSGDDTLEKKWRWQTSVSEDEGCLDCDRMTTPNFGERAVCSDTSSSSISFNGPYIFFKGTPEPTQAPADGPREAKVKDAQCGPVQSAPTAPCFRDDYVFLPGAGPPGPVEELATHGNHHNDYAPTTEGGGRERRGQDVEEGGRGRAGLLPGPGNCDPQPYTVMQFPAAPQGGTVQPSGYCVLP